MLSFNGLKIEMGQQKYNLYKDQTINVNCCIFLCSTVTWIVASLAQPEKMIQKKQQHTQLLCKVTLRFHTTEWNDRKYSWQKKNRTNILFEALKRKNQFWAFKGLVARLSLWVFCGVVCSERIPVLVGVRWQLTLQKKENNYTGVTTWPKNHAGKL